LSGIKAIAQIPLKTLVNGGGARRQHRQGRASKIGRGDTAGEAAMRFKNILVHIARDDAGRARIDTAARLAEAHQGKLIGLSTVAQPTPILVEGSAAAAGIWAEQMSQHESDAKEAAEEFMDAMRRRGVPAEARVASGFEETAGGTLALNARYCDLAVVGGRDACASRTLADTLIDGALFDSGRPAMILPAEGAGETIGARPLLAWDGGPQAARAAADALPFLAGAAHVRVCVAATYFGMSKHGDEPGADIGRWLASHGAKVAVEVIEPGDRSVAESLTDAARRDGCDMIVMGGFGHSRLRESLLGGVTSDFLDKPPLPLFVAH
jgi:nucleotide-binding universal stress UspA family protein